MVIKTVWALREEKPPSIRARLGDARKIGHSAHFAAELKLYQATSLKVYLPFGLAKSPWT
jgi:hypothetical protein